MRLKSDALVGIAAVTSLLLLAAIPSAAAAPTSTPLTLNIQGGIVDSGHQAYSQSGGNLLCTYCFAEILGQPVDPTTATFSESVSSTTDGLSTSGSASFSLSGTMLNGSTFSISGPIGIVDSVPGEAFPVGCWDGVTLPLPAGCSSAVPAFFIGGGDFDVTVTHSWSLSVGMDMESAFLNPFGGAIVWASTDPASSIVLAFSYDSAAIDWQNVQLAGTISGSLGTTPTPTPVSGQFSQTTTSAHEDLLAGTEVESGTMTFQDMTPSGLDSSGTYSGSSTIPTAGEVDCSSFTTGIPGTCTETGFSSSGMLSLDPVTVLVQADYKLDWIVPALAFTGTATGTATPSGGGIPGVPQFGLSALLPAALALPLLLLMRARLRK